MGKLNLTVDLDNLTEKEREKFFKLVEKSKKPFNPFERVKQGMNYVYVDDEGFPIRAKEKGIECDNWRFLHHNYYSNEEFAGHQALRELLNRKLMKFSYENGGADIDTTDSYKIFTNYEGEIDWCHTRVPDILTPVFISEEVAQKAIEEVVKPFIKEHPNFKWWG